MRAVIIDEPGGPDALRLVERADPRPGPDDLLVAVHASAVNRADLLQREGRYPPPDGATDVPGLELAGEVVDMGARVRGWERGDEVCAVVAGGGYAELAVVPAATAMPMPPGVDLVSAGGVAEVFATAWDNLVRRGGLRRGEVALVHGGSSGVGTAAIQLAVREGARVITTASTPAKLAVCRDLGAEVAIDYTSEDFSDRAREVTEGRGVDVILDMLGASYLEPNLRALAIEGRLVIIGLMGGARAEIDLARLLIRRLTVRASTLRARSVVEKAELAAALTDTVWPGFGDGSLRPVIDRVFPLDEVAAAHRRMESGEHVGKLILQVR